MGWLIGFGLALGVTLWVRAKERSGSVEQKSESHETLDRALTSMLNTRPLQSVNPIPGLSDVEWRKLLQWAMQGRVDTITAGYLMGTYLLDPRELSDLGYLQGLRRVKYKGREVYIGDWVPPYSEAQFLSDPELQHTIFVRLMSHYASVVGSRYGAALGQALVDWDGAHGRTFQVAEAWESIPLSLGGLLAVTKQVGLAGLDKWLMRWDQRKSTGSDSRAWQEYQATR